MDVKKADEWEAVKKIVLEFVELTTAMEGTMSAEHGLGMAKSPVIARELGATGLELMQTVKDALDPQGILNPGKMGLKDSIADVYESSGFEPLRLGAAEVASFGEVDNEIVACIQCGFCRLGCPTYAQTDLESMNAKGRITLAFSLLAGHSQPSAEMAERLYKCMLCLNCKYTLPGPDQRGLGGAGRPPAPGGKGLPAGDLQEAHERHGRGGQPLQHAPGDPH